jgi:hypothetical protein
MQAHVLQTHYNKTTNLSTLSKDHHKLWPKKNSVDQRSIVFSLFSFFSSLFFPFKNFSFKRFSLLKKLASAPPKKFQNTSKNHEETLSSTSSSSPPPSSSSLFNTSVSNNFPTENLAV